MKDDPGLMSRAAGFLARFLAPGSRKARDARWRRHLKLADKAEAERRRFDVEQQLMAAYRLAKEFGEQDMRLVRSVEELADYYENAGNYNESESFYKKAIQLRESIQGEDHFEVGRAVNNLAVLHYAQGKFQEAVALFDRVLKILEDTRGPEDREVAVLLGNYAAVMRKLDRRGDSDRMLERANAIRRKYKHQREQS